MANRAFGTQLSINESRRALAPLNIHNQKRSEIRQVKAVSIPSNIPLEDQENRIYVKNKPVNLKESRQQSIAVSKCTTSKSTFQVFEDSQNDISSQEESLIQPVDDEKLLDDNIEAVKKELNNFLIDSQEKCGSQGDDHQEDEKSCLEDACMVTVAKDGLTEGLSSSELSFIQQSSDFDCLAEYRDEIMPYILQKERMFMPDPFYMANQPNINTKMRSILVDWLVDVADEYNIKDETLFLAVNYIDRFLSKVSITRTQFQLLGTAALFIAAKYEEIYPPEICDFVYITDDSFSKLQILQMEKMILTVLNFNVSCPTSNYFLEKYLSDLELDKETYCLSKYLCFLTLLESTPFLKYYPSEIALCSILLATKTLGAVDKISLEFLQETLRYEHSLGAKGDVQQLLNDRSTLLDELGNMQLFAKGHQQQAIQRKYREPKYFAVADLLPQE